MSTLTSPDGTTIAYTRTGDGPPLILVDGAMCYRGAGPMDALAALLQDSFTVYTYDRRGRGESTDTLPHAVEREVEDLAALVAVAGGPAGVYAMSSGGALALATAATTPGIDRLALYEPPYTAEAGLQDRADAVHGRAGGRAARTARRRGRRLPVLRRRPRAGRRRDARGAGLGPPRGDRADAHLRQRPDGAAAGSRAR